MLARTRTQLRLLLFTIVATALLALPVGAHAAAVLTLAGDPDPAQPDNGVTFTGGEDMAEYGLVVDNASVDPSVNAVLTITFQTDELQFEDYFADDGGDFDSCSSQTIGAETQVDCDIVVAGNDQTSAMVYLSTVNGFTGTTTTVDFAVVNDSVTADTLSDTTTWEYFPTCANFGYFYDNRFTRAELQANGTLTFSIDCTDFDGGALTLTPKVGTNGTLSGTASSVTFTATPAALASPNGFHEYFEGVVLTDDEGDTTTADIFVAAYTQSNTSSTISGPTTFAVPAAGGTVTYTNTVRNAGPDALGQVGFGWEISDKATLVSATAGGAAVTCQPASYGGEGFRAYGCGSAAMPAVGATVTGTITVRYAAGEKGLALPATVKVTASAGPDSTTGAEDRSYDDNQASMVESGRPSRSHTPSGAR